MSGRVMTTALRSIVLVAAATIGLGFPGGAAAAAKDCDTQADTGNRVKCRMENLSEAFDGFVTTVAGDDTGTFSEKQKKQFEDMRTQMKNETGRTPPEDFKQMGKKRDVECFVQEILGDVTAQNDKNGNGECDGNEECIGNEDGVCDQEEMSKGGCAEVLNDGIGDDDGVCEQKGKYDEACIKICDSDLTMAVGNETNVERGRADDVEQSLEDATAVVEGANLEVAAALQSRKRAAAALSAACDKSTMGACEYLECTMLAERAYPANVIEGMVGGAQGAKILADMCRDGAKWDKIINYSALCAIPGLIQSGFQIAAVVLENSDDSRTSERMDALGLCVQESAGKIEAIKTSVEQVIELLKTPPGQRAGYPAKSGK